ncbi:MAG: GAF domain-containing protein [Chloroflexi bacterium]|nr:GAF domain-containing protein [Chloroflexota bacterium]
MIDAIALQKRRAQSLAPEQAARTQAEAAQRRLVFLAEAGSVLCASLDYEATLAHVARLAVPYLADWCTVRVLEDDQSLHLVGVAHVDPAKEELVRTLARPIPLASGEPHPIVQVALTGQPTFYPRFAHSLAQATPPDAWHRKLIRELGVVSCIMLPLVARGRTLGAICLASSESRRRYGPGDLALAEELARRCAVAVDNTRLYREAQQGLIREQAARAEAEAQRTRLHAILQSTPHGILFIEAETGRMVANPAARQLFGCPIAPEVGHVHAVGHLRHPDGRPLEVEEFPSSRALRGQVVVDEELLVIHPDGRGIPALVSAAPVRDPQGRVAGVVEVLQDLSAFKGLERLQEDFLSMMIHELKTPITAIKAVAGGLLREGVVLEAAIQRELLRAVEEEADHLAQLVADLLDVARLEARALPLDLERCHLVDLVREHRRHLDALAQDHLLQVEVPLDLPEVLADYDQVGRVIANLVSNAAKYSPPGNAIVVRAAPGTEGRQVVVSVADRGVGIPPAELGRVFEKFYRVREQGERVPGVGLGLALCKGIVQAHGGSIWVESVPGQGSTFRFSLPLAPGERATE